MKDALRLGMRRLAAGVCIISTQVDDRRYAMTASSVTSLSDDPASLLVCVNKEAAMQPWLHLGRMFVVNVLSQEQQNLSNLCASRDEGVERFSQGNWQLDAKGMPYLADAQANFFCRVDNDNYLYGTHQIVIGRLENVLISASDVNPLIYVDGAYAGI
jgi:flavin reductase (DIM6/NTAB) family NADH-FMN oxidoreductase RutF